MGDSTSGWSKKRGKEVDAEGAGPLRRVVTHQETLLRLQNRPGTCQTLTFSIPSLPFHSLFLGLREYILFLLNFLVSRET